jgi:hypothetical protein
VIGGETEGPHESGARAQLAGDDLGSRGEARGEGAVDHLPHRAQQQLAGARQVPADDDARRVEDAGDIGRGDADVRARLGDGADADIVAGHGPHDDVAELEPRVAGLEPLDDGVSSRDRLEASEVAAAAQRAVLDDHGVAELARAAARAAVPASTDHEAGADPVAHLDEHGVALAAQCSQAMLREGGQIRGVVDHHGHPQGALDGLADRDALPTPHDAGASDHAACGIHRRRDRDTHGEQLVAIRRHGLEHVGEQHADATDLVVGAVIARERHLVLGDHGEARVGERHAQLPLGEVDAAHQPRGVRERDVLGAAARSHRLRGAEHARFGELLDDVGDGGGGEARRARELDLREPPVLLDGVDDAAAIRLAQRRLRPRGAPLVRHAFMVAAGRRKRGSAGCA